MQVARRRCLLHVAVCAVVTYTRVATGASFARGWGVNFPLAWCVCWCCFPGLYSLVASCNTTERYMRRACLAVGNGWSASTSAPTNYHCSTTAVPRAPLGEVSSAGHNAALGDRAALWGSAAHTRGEPPVIEMLQGGQCPPQNSGEVVLQAERVSKNPQHVEGWQRCELLCHMRCVLETVERNVEGEQPLQSVA